MTRLPASVTETPDPTILWFWLAFVTITGLTILGAVLAAWLLTWWRE